MVTKCVNVDITETHVVIHVANEQAPRDLKIDIIDKYLGPQYQSCQY